MNCTLSLFFGVCSALALLSMPGNATEYPDPYAPPFYNNEIVPLPNWAKEEFRDINAKLRAKLSPSDYLEILKGEHHLLKDAPTRGHAIQGKSTDGLSLQELSHPTKLKAKLQQILAHPDDDTIFARPHFVTHKTAGIFFQEDIRYAEADLREDDDLYILSRSSNPVHSSAGICDFWNTRTCRKEAAFAIPTSVFYSRKPQRLLNKKVYHMAHVLPSDFGGCTWAGKSTCEYIIHPEHHLYESHYNISWLDDPPPSSGALSMQHNINIGDTNPTYDESTGALTEIGLHIDDEDTLYNRSQNGWKNTIYHPLKKSTQILMTSSLMNSGWCLNLHSLKYKQSVDDRSFPNTDKIRQNTNNILSNIYSPYNGPGRAEPELNSISRWGTKHLSHSGNRVIFSVCDYDDYYLGITLPDKSVRLLPNFATLSRNKVTKTLTIEQQGIKYWDDYYENEDKHRAKKVPVLNTEGITFHGDVLKIQSHLQPDETLHIFISAESQKNLGTECWQLKLSKDSHFFTIARHWKYANSRLLAHYHADLNIMFIPACNNSYWVKKLLPDGGEKDMGRLFVNPTQGYAWVLPDGRYAGSPGCEAFLGFGDGKTTISMEALAPWRNRPAEVLEALEGNPDDIAALRQTTERWLKKQGYDIHAMPAEPKLADFAQMDVQLPPLFTTHPKLEVEVEIQSAEKRAVTALEVRVDGVCIPQSWDANLLIPAGQKRKLTVTVPLGSGQNWIELKPVDSLGTSGATFQFRTIYKGQNKPEMYIVSLGVSDYADDTLDLQYAAKDARDVAAAFEKHSGYRVRTLTLTDAEVTPQALGRVQGFLSAATPDDCVVLYVAGHGMLDEQLNYFYAPHHFTPENVAGSGISMEALRGCLTSSPARKRLLLLDTCHSGSVGEADMDKLAMSGVQLPHGVRAIANRGMKVTKVTGGLSNQQQTKRYIEEMFSAGTAQDGINVLSGSAGAEFAMESDQWSNGVFTTALISTLKNPTEADTDKNARLSMGELLLHVPAQVRQMTGGMQSPSIQMVENVKPWTIQPCPADSPAAMQQWVKHFERTTSLNDHSYMRDCYEPQITNLKTGKTMSIDDLISVQRSYSEHWAERRFDLHDYKIKGNRIEIRSSYSCTNIKGKTVYGYCKTTWIISPNGRIQAIEDVSNTKQFPEFSAEVSDTQQQDSLQEKSSNTPHSAVGEVEAYQWNNHLLQYYPLNDLSYMRNCYEPTVTEIKSGKTMSIDELIKAQYSYTSRWVTRSCMPHDFAWGNNRVEIRFRYTCTNTKGKTVSGYCKATWQISENGRIEAYADDSSTTAWPAFSSEVGPPQVFH